MYKTEKKADFSLLHRSMLEPGIKALEHGVSKYGRLNYLTNEDVSDEELIAAARRHILEDIGAVDAESQVEHWGCAMANIMMLFHRRAAPAPAQPAPSKTGFSSHVFDVLGVCFLCHRHKSEVSEQRCYPRAFPVK